MIETKIVVYPYITASCRVVECWVADMAKQGWHLTEVTGWKFTFKKISPQPKEYFMYVTFRNHKGLPNNYFGAKKRYQKSKMPLNKNVSKMFEIDILKKDAEFEQYVYTRYQYCKKHYIGALVLFLALGILGGICSFKDLRLLPLTAIPLAVVVYSVLSLMILKITHNKY